MIVGSAFTALVINNSCIRVHLLFIFGYNTNAFTMLI